MNIIAVTQKGLNKTENEDRIVVGKTILANGTLFSKITDGIIAVADGVGGRNAGSVASHFIANKICNLSEVSLDELSAINNELINTSEINETQNGMATTLSGICVGSEKSQLFSIGNTRVYLLQSGKYLKQLTSDDTTVSYLIATGQLSPQEAENFERKNEIIACFGGGASELFKMKVSYIETITAPIIITSDGIHDYLSVDQMEEIIEEYGLTEASCNELIRLARINGSIDDASIILGGV